ncbi:hypothetical protein BKA69DRAFT_344840 [Paraphysoderma sedebokerense]|nr:hypothetical protein BKA69DRAFT_344840 [Paraphysoderma sedebokerense]
MNNYDTLQDENSPNAVGTDVTENTTSTAAIRIAVAPEEQMQLQPRTSDFANIPRRATTDFRSSFATLDRASIHTGRNIQDNPIVNDGRNSALPGWMVRGIANSEATTLPRIDTSKTTIPTTGTSPRSPENTAKAVHSAMTKMRILSKMIVSAKSKRANDNSTTATPVTPSVSNNSHGNLQSPPAVHDQSQSPPNGASKEFQAPKEPLESDSSEGFKTLPFRKRSSTTSTKRKDLESQEMVVIREIMKGEPDIAPHDTPMENIHILVHGLLERKYASKEDIMKDPLSQSGRFRPRVASAGDVLSRPGKGKIDGGRNEFVGGKILAETKVTGDSSSGLKNELVSNSTSSVSSRNQALKLTLPDSVVHEVSSRQEASLTPIESSLETGLDRSPSSRFNPKTTALMFPHANSSSTSSMNQSTCNSEPKTPKVKTALVNFSGSNSDLRPRAITLNTSLDHISVSTPSSGFRSKLHASFSSLVRPAESVKSNKNKQNSPLKSSANSSTSREILKPVSNSADLSVSMPSLGGASGNNSNENSKRFGSQSNLSNSYHISNPIPNVASDSKDPASSDPSQNDTSSERDNTPDVHPQLDFTIPALYVNEDLFGDPEPAVKFKSQDSLKKARTKTEPRPFTLRFDPDLEQLYSIYYFHQNRAILGALLVHLFAIYINYITFSIVMYRGPLVLLTLPGPVLSLFITVLVAVWWRYKLLETDMVVLNLIIGCCLGGVLLWNNILRDVCSPRMWWDNVIHLNAFLFCGYIYWFLRISYHLRTAIGWSFTGLQIIVDVIGLCSVESKISNAILYCAANCVGMFFAYVSEYINRQSFLKTRMIYKHQANLHLAREQSEALLRMVLPAKIISDLKSGRDAVEGPYGGRPRFSELRNVSILFADIVGFTEFSSKVSPKKLVIVLSELFAKFDSIAESLNLEKIKTIGDCYQCVAGVPDEPKTDEEISIQCSRLCSMALEIIAAIAETSRKIKYQLHVRVGIHTGSVMAGIIGIHKLKYDVWSADVDLASLMEQTASPDVLHISETTYSYLKNHETFIFKPAADVIFHHQPVRTYDLVSPSPQQSTKLANKFAVNFNDQDLLGLGRAKIAAPVAPLHVRAASLASIHSDVSARSNDQKMLFFQQFDTVERLLFDNAATQETIAAQRRLFKSFEEEISWTGSFVNPSIEEDYKNDYMEHQGYVFVRTAKVFCIINLMLFAYLAIEFRTEVYAYIIHAIFLFSISFFTFTVSKMYKQSLLQFEGKEFERGSSSHSSLWMGDKENISADSFSKFEKWTKWKPNLLALILMLCAFFALIPYLIWLDPRPKASYHYAYICIVLMSCTLFVGLRMRYFSILGLLMVVVFDIIYYIRITMTFEDTQLDASYLQAQLLFAVLLAMITSTNRSMDILFRRNFQMKRFLQRKNTEMRMVQKDTERLLLNIFPLDIAQRLKANPTSRIADAHEDVSILFCSLANFHKLDITPTVSLSLLNEIISDVDEICQQFNVEKIKTIGTKYMAMAKDEGLISTEDMHIFRIAEFALQLQTVIETHNNRFREEYGIPNLTLKTGINSGPIVAGILGTSKFSFDIWGDAVNVAARMEASCPDNAIHVTEAVYERLKEVYEFEARGEIYVKGKGNMRTYLLTGRKLREGRTLSMAPGSLGIGRPILGSNVNSTLARRLDEKGTS